MGGRPGNTKVPPALTRRSGEHRAVLSSLAGPGTPSGSGPVGLGGHVAVSCHLGAQSTIPTAGPRLLPTRSRRGPGLSGPELRPRSASGECALRGLMRLGIYG